jgi:hypothetical protein
MRRTTTRQTIVNRPHARTTKAALDPYMVDEVAFTRDEILRARAHD